jgi:RecA-family ATPase
MPSTSSKTTSAPSAKPATKPATVSLQYHDRSDLYDLWLARSTSQDWVLKDLVMMGDQIILAGAPKTYKSLWASHLALALSMGVPDFLGWGIPKSRKVLVLSMEMREELSANRILHQLEHLAPIDFQETPEADIRAKPIIHVFDVNGKHSIDVVQESDFESLYAVILEEDPEVVIFDSLIRFHHADENSNPHMSEVMQKMRELCVIPFGPQDVPDPFEPSPKKITQKHRTSIIIHHNRKEGGGAKSYSAASIRGASSIHSEADLILTSFPLLKTKEVSINFSARKIQEPEFIVIGLNEKSLLIELREKKHSKETGASSSPQLQHLPFALQVLAENREVFLSWTKIQELALKIKRCPKKGASHPSAYSKYFREVFESYCESKGTGNRTEYRLKEEIDPEDEEFIANLEAQLSNS